MPKILDKVSWLRRLIGLIQEFIQGFVRVFGLTLRIRIDLNLETSSSYERIRVLRKFLLGRRTKYPKASLKQLHHEWPDFDFSSATIHQKKAIVKRPNDVLLIM